MKMKLKIINIIEEEQNPFYDKDRSNNGGGYHQPLIKITLNNGVTWEVDDTSCGDFGDRFTISSPFGSAHYESMGELSVQVDRFLVPFLKELVNLPIIGWYARQIIFSL